jgi:hypothetical protein
MAGLVLIAALAAFAAIQIRGGDGDDVTESRTISTEHATTEQSKMVAEAIAQFDDAGLELSALQIEFYGGNDGCQDHAGVFVAASRDPQAFVDRITICSHYELVLLHELAHAWMHHNLDDETKDAFTTHWGLDAWNDSNDAWGDRGVERAAHTIAFTLNQSEPTDNKSILRYICDYALLTGSTIEIHTKMEC